MDAIKEKSPTARSGCTQMLASNVFINSTPSSTAHQLTAVLTVMTRIYRVAGGAA